VQSPAARAGQGLRSIRQRLPDRELERVIGQREELFRGEFDEADQAIGQGYCPLDGSRLGPSPERAGRDWTMNSDVAFVASRPSSIWP
jgi:hypothetical protein